VDKGDEHGHREDIAGPGPNTKRALRNWLSYQIKEFNHHIPYFLLIY
jgi:hypothetical protein